jgi:hypothetical protein
MLDITGDAQMGWLNFLASIIGSLAWPGVVLIVLWYNRRRLANLPDWLDELTLPGGAKIKFTRALESATAAVSGASHTQAESPVEDAPFANQFPEALVVHSFIEIVETLGSMVRLLPLPTKARGPTFVVNELARLGYIDQTTVKIFTDLQDAYTAAVRAGYVRLTAEEGFRYREAAQKLNARLREVLPRLEVENPRQKAWGTP